MRVGKILSWDAEILTQPYGGGYTTFVMSTEAIFKKSWETLPIFTEEVCKSDFANITNLKIEIAKKKCVANK